jgi:hypothetical protein
MAVDRRSFVLGPRLSVAATVSARTTKADAQVRTLELTIDRSKRFATMPRDFLGLSYESAQLADPAFFAASNTTLVRRRWCELCPRQVFRLGGNRSDVTLSKRRAAQTIAPQDATQRSEARAGLLRMAGSRTQGGERAARHAWAHWARCVVSRNQYFVTLNSTIAVAFL